MTPPKAGKPTKATTPRTWERWAVIGNFSNTLYMPLHHSERSARKQDGRTKLMRIARVTITEVPPK